MSPECTAAVFATHVEPAAEHAALQSAPIAPCTQFTEEEDGLSHCTELPQPLHPLPGCPAPVPTQMGQSVPQLFELQMLAHDGALVEQRQSRWELEPLGAPLHWLAPV